MSLDNLDALIESFGTDRDKFLSSKEIVDDILLEWGQSAIDAIRIVLAKEKLIASGDLYSQIEPWKIKKIQNGIQIYLEMLEHWEDVDKGREKGKRLTQNELNSLSDWIQIKGIPQKWKMDKKSVLFLISRSIYRRGTIKRYGYKGSNFLEKAMTDRIMTTLQDKFAQSLEGYYLKPLKKS